MNAIKQYMIENSMTYEAMSRKTGIKLVTLWRHANGSRGVTLKFAMIYNKKLKIPMASLPTEPILQPPKMDVPGGWPPHDLE